MNTLNYSFRYLANRRGNTLARFVSLSLGLFVAIIIFAQVGFEYSYERWIPDNKRIYTLGTSSYGSPRIVHGLFYPIYERILNETPQIEAGTIVGRDVRDISYDDKDAVSTTIGYVSETFFDVFDIKVLSGDPKTVLSSPYTAMISEKCAKKLFGEENPLGKSVKVYSADNTEVSFELTVQGVYRGWEGKPTRLYGLVGPEVLMQYHPTRAEISHPVYKWELMPVSIYVKLHKKAKVEDVKLDVIGIAKRAGAPEKFIHNCEVNKTVCHITPVCEFYTDNHSTLRVLSGVAILALVVACLNYVLLSISSLTERSRTIAMLRCHGAQKSDIFRLFLVETLLIVGSATLWTAFMIWCLEKEILTMVGWHLNTMFSLNLLWIPVVVCCVAFLLAGILFDPLAGGITKDYCNLAYLLTTTGMTSLTGAFVLALELKWQIKGRGLSGCGQNPMLAYGVTNFFTGPVLAMLGVGAWLDAISVGSPFWGIIRGLVYTLLMVAVTCFFTKKKLFWRS